MGTPAVAFLRGVNLGARNRVPQRALAEALAAELEVPVRHLLQSGNLVVAEADPATLAMTVSEIISDQTALQIPVIVRDAGQLRALLASDPWRDADPVTVHLSVWDDPHDDDAARAMAQAEWRGDEIRFVPGGAWMRFTAGSHASPLGNHAIERKLGVTATARNARTIAELVRMLDA